MNTHSGTWKKRTLSLCLLLMTVCLMYGADLDYSLLKGHPRLFMDRNSETEINNAIQKYPLMKNLHQLILRNCDYIITQPLTKFDKVGIRLSGDGEVMSRIFDLCYAWRMTRQERYALRAKEEMMAAARYQNWVPTHFLGTAAMMTSLSFGYDQLYDYLSAAERDTIAEAVITKGMDEAIRQKDAFFYRTPNNWNSVCNCGLLCAGIAFYDRVPDKAKTLIERVLASNPIALRTFGPDGGYPEGFGYWEYGTDNQVMLIECLRRAFGTDAGLAEIEGFKNTGRYALFMRTPTGGSFNYSDGGQVRTASMQLPWFAAETGDASLLFPEVPLLKSLSNSNHTGQCLPKLMVYASRIDWSKVKEPEDHFLYCRGDLPMFVYRSGWDSNEDAYLGLRGGGDKVPHCHMDAGSFIYEWGGVRWATDLGGENYNNLETNGVDLWNYGQNGGRWTVLRHSNQAHNVVVINNQKQLVDGKAEFVKFYKSERKKGATLDMSSVLGHGIIKALRTVTLDRDNSLTTEDKMLTQKSPTIVRWTMVTEAMPRVMNSRMALLTKGSRQMLLFVESPYGTNIEVTKNEPWHDYEAANPGTYRITVTAILPADRWSRIAVKLSPY